MSDLRKRILAGGILLLCLLSLVWTDDGHKVIGLTELLALCGAWACMAWLWDARITERVKARVTRFHLVTKKFLARFYIAIAFSLWAMAVGLFVWQLPTKGAHPKKPYGDVLVEGILREIENESTRANEQRGREFSERLARYENEWHGYKGPLSKDDWILERISKGD